MAKRGRGSGKALAIVNPATGETIARVPEAGADEVDLACRVAARTAEGPWRKTTPRERARILFQIAAVVRENVEELAAVETRNAGKTVGDARWEAAHVADVFEYYAGAVSKYFGETVPVSNPGLLMTLREPVGVCGLIVPWNFPAVIAAWKLAPALACGNGAVLKPAPETPLSALKLAEYCAKGGLPDGVLSVVCGGPETGAALVAHPLARKISFTGSTRTGAAVMKAAADSLKRVSLELGGKSANIVFHDVVDLDDCVEKSLWSAFGNAGQDCCARSRFLLHASIYERFLEKLVARAKSVVLGDPAKRGVEMGPLISERQREKVAAYVQLGRREGCRLLCGGEAPPRGPLSKGFFFTPAVLAGATPKMRVFQEEIFGPVICATPFKTEAEAVALANDSEYGLSGSIWTRDLGRGLRMAKAVKSGNLSVNAATSVYLEAPFGGFKGSGVGRELGMKALDLYSETKTVFISES